MTATIKTLPHYFPQVFAFRVTLTTFCLAVLIFISIKLYKNKKIDAVQCGCMIALFCYTVFLLYHTVIGRYSQEFYRYDGEIFGTIKRLFENFNIFEFSQLLINLFMMVPISFLLMVILRCNFKTIIAFDLTVGLSVVIELLQFFTRAGTLQLDDIIYNIASAVLGILIYYLVLLVLIKKRNEKT